MYFEEAKKLNAYAATDIGRQRSVNQDFLFCSVRPVGNLPNLFVVADGMGGHNAGEYASRYTVDHLVEWIEATSIKEVVPIIEGAICSVNESLWNIGRQVISMRGLGTTLVVATIIDDVLYVANIGDSRLYLFCDELKQITRDHSYVEELVNKGIIERDSMEYWNYKNVITRAVGTSRRVKADFFEYNLSGKEILLLCSDGLTNMVQDETIRTVLREKKTVKEKVLELIERANKNGGQDNIAVILADLREQEEEVC